MLICCYFGLRITVPSPSTVSTLILSHCTGQKVIKNDMKIKIKEEQSLKYSRYHNTVNTTSINPNSPTMLYSQGCHVSICCDIGLGALLAGIPSCYSVVILPPVPRIVVSFRRIYYYYFVCFFFSCHSFI